ncbi:glycosyltransferase family 2 protein [Candidatus Parcubacteria bacterium]|nr:glycosyltransferase family 2 protein [Candidatus Parcubacteria bacterium]
MQDYIHIGNALDIKDSHDRRVYRLLEMLPGFLAWFTLALIILVSYQAPVFAAVFIILFDIYWLIKTVYLSLLTRSSFERMKKNMKANWVEKLEALNSNDQLAGVNWKDLYHLVILPVAREPYTIVRESLHSILNSNYDRNRLIVVLATEGRTGEHATMLAQEATKEFGDSFFKFHITTHPANLEGEIPGKGSNEAWAGTKIKEEIIDPLQIPYERVVVSVFDIDTIVPRDFFACLSWYYMTASDPLHSSFQPIPIFNNNIWEAPAFARVFAFSTTFWQMIQQARPEQLVTFSSQSIGFKALVDIGFWQKNMVSEDSRIYWQCLLHYDGNWRTIPMYYPVYMDANVAPTFWQTLKNQYKQIRRWHYGAENNPYFMYGFMKNKNIPLWKKWQYTLVKTEHTHSSPTNALIIFLLGWLPVWVGGSAFTGSILSYNLPRITSTILNAALLGLITSAILSIALLPPKPPHYGKFKWVWMFLQWILFPVNFILFGAIPALDAQTRLMFGKYMGFWVTPKDRKAGAAQPALTHQ